ncbi:hypothetical protein [Kordia aestuariivivens]|nr:hypothetical protein [Kordia aestuariivivens]
MKKRNLTSLKLNKKLVSNLDSIKIKGGLPQARTNVHWGCTHK